MKCVASYYALPISLFGPHFFVIFYYVWSDLVTVVSYLRDITLWQQTSTTEAGVVTETISLFNLIVALIIVVITYILVRNIQGILEVLIFSRVKLFTRYRLILLPPY